jgi:hypothetical protein
MSTKKFKGTLITGHSYRHVSKDFEFDTEDELRTWLEDEQPGEQRHKHTTAHVIRSGHHAVKRYKWENGSLITETEGFETLEEAKAYVESFDDHHIAKIYCPNGELLHETGPLAETYA